MSGFCRVLFSSWPLGPSPCLSLNHLFGYLKELWRTVGSSLEWWKPSHPARVQESLEAHYCIKLHHKSLGVRLTNGARSVAKSQTQQTNSDYRWTLSYLFSPFVRKKKHSWNDMAVQARRESETKKERKKRTRVVQSQSTSTTRNEF